MTETTTAPSPGTQMPTGKDDSELRYLLTAYLFDSLSEEGRLEVERQLENSETCREELEELRGTLSILTDALDPAGVSASSYSFEKKRMERVLEASRGKSPLRLLARPSMLSAAAAVLLFIGIAIPLLLSRIESTAPVTGLSQSFEDSADGVVAESSFAESRAQFAPRNLHKGEKSAESPSPQKPVILTPKTISSSQARRSAAPARQAEKTGQKRSVSSNSGVILKPGDPGRTGGAAPAATAASTETRAVDDAVDVPSSKIARDGNSIIDVIGVGGGAAGTYGKRFGRGRVAREGNKKQDEKEGASRAAPRKEIALIGREKSKLSAEKKLYKKSQIKRPASPPEAETERGAIGKAFSRLAEEEPQELNKDKKIVRLQDELGKIAGIQKNRFDQSGEDNSRVIRNELRRVQSQQEEMKERGEGEEGDEGKDAKKNLESIEEARPTGPQLLDQLAQTSQAPRDARRNFYSNDSAYNLNIAKTGNGYLSLGKGKRRIQLAATAQQGRSSAAGPVEINEMALNSYAWYRGMDPNLSYEQFNSRALTVPAPALGDEGLGEKGFRKKYGVNPFVATSRDHLSTFGMDVDNASWGRTLETIRNQELPPPETVRVEEFINNFPDHRPGNPENVFTVYTEGGPSPFGDHELELVQVTIKSRKLLPGERRDAILTFAIDTSGSMADNGKLQLLKDSIRTLVSNLEPNDRVAIVAFSTNAYVVLPHTSVRQKNEIDGAIASLEANGGTNVEAGIDLAYRLAAESSNRRAANRVILCSDGVANLGARGPEAVLQRIRRYARDNLVSLFTYAFGTGGRQAVRGDRMLQRLADEGDGRYQYVDSASTSRDIFSLPDQLQILASDAKIQVNFNPDVVSHYRLLGYEKRDIADKDFRNDTVDAGEVGPGATVTAIYEIKRTRPVGSLGRIHLRYLDTVSGRVEETDFDLPPGILAERLTDTTDRFRLIASVAEFAELLRGSYYARNGSYGAILQLMSEFPPGARNQIEFAEIYRTVGKAQGLCAVRTLQNIKE